MNNLEHITNWWIKTVDKNDIVFDHVFISYESNVVAFLPFKRAKSYSYSELNDEYTITHSKNVQFLNLLTALKHLEKPLINKAA